MNLDRAAEAVVEWSAMSRSTLAIMLLAAACEKAGAPGPAPAAPPADAAAAREVEPIDRCRGSDLDLAALAGLRPCETRGGGEVSLEASWRVSVDPDPVEVRSGDSVKIRLVFTNTAPSARELTLDVPLLSDLSMARAHDGRGRR